MNDETNGDNNNNHHFSTLITNKLSDVFNLEQFNLNFHRGNVVKYTIRAGRKDEIGYENLEKAIEDLTKAKWYLDRQIEEYKNLMENEDGSKSG